MSKISEYLSEPTDKTIDLLLETNVKLTSIDEKTIKSIIKIEKNAEINLQSFPDDTITVINNEESIVIKFNKELCEVTNFIVDFCDENGYIIRDDYIVNNITQYLEFEKEKEELNA